MSDMYKNSGVDVETGNNFIKQIMYTISSTYTKSVIQGIGGFGSIFQITDKLCLVSSIDGLGSIVRLAQKFDNLEDVGKSIVNHCINDILTIGARPIYFLDYLAANKLNIIELKRIINGMVCSAIEHNVAIVGGETAEMPLSYKEKEMDVVGVITGIVEKKDIINSINVMKGDILIGLPSNGVHTNGYTLINRLFDNCLLGRIDLLNDSNRFGMIHRSYYFEMMDFILDIKKERNVQDIIHAIAHITGGGFNNILRVIPKDLCILIKRNSWPKLEIFEKIQLCANLDVEEMYNVFNMGIGMVLVINAKEVYNFVKYYRGSWYIIGAVISKKENNSRISFE